MEDVKLNVDGVQLIELVPLEDTSFFGQITILEVVLCSFVISPAILYMLVKFLVWISPFCRM